MCFFVSKCLVYNISPNVPTIWYIGNDGKNHRHYVDIFIPTENRCIEVKGIVL